MNETREHLYKHTVAYDKSETVVEEDFIKVSTEVKVYEVRAYCPNDNVELEATGWMHTTSPPKYPHECPSCGYKISLSRAYPTTEFK